MSMFQLGDANAYCNLTYCVANEALLATLAKNPKSEDIQEP